MAGYAVSNSPQSPSLQLLGVFSLTMLACIRKLRTYLFVVRFRTVRPRGPHPPLSSVSTSIGIGISNRDFPHGINSECFQNSLEAPTPQPSRFVPREKTSCLGVPLRAENLARRKQTWESASGCLVSPRCRAVQSLFA